MDFSIGLVVDGILALLLVLVIIACFMVYLRLKAMREGQAEMAGVVDSLNHAVSEAQRGIQALRQAADEADEKLSGKVKSARALADELTLITETGNNIADRIERGATANREATSSDGSMTGSPAAGSTTGSQIRKGSSSGARDKSSIAKKQRDLMSAIKQAR